MITKKTSIKVGYTKGNLCAPDYKNWDRENQASIDITAVDGLGNVITVNVRQGENGHRIELNGKVLSLTN